MAALLRQATRRLGGSMLQRTRASVTSPAVAEQRRRLLLPRRMLFCNTDKRAPEEITGDIQRKQRDLCDAIEDGKRSLKAATDWRKQQELYDAIAKARRTVAAATKWCDEDPQKYFRRLKPHQIFLGSMALIFMLAEAIVTLIAIGFMMSMLYAAVVETYRELKRRKAEELKREH